MTEDQHAQLDRIAYEKTSQAMYEITVDIAHDAILKLKADQLDVFNAMCKALDACRIGLRAKMNEIIIERDADPAA
jgi:hypothetical protein